MRIISSSEYKGYMVTVVVVPQVDRTFTSMFSLDKDSERVQILSRSTVTEADPVYHSSISSPTRFATADEAREASAARAHAWIDAATADGYEIRQVNDTTGGDYISFEMFVGNRWREIRISNTALAILDKGEHTRRLDVFEQHLAKILRAAAPKALAAQDAPFLQLNEHL